MWNNVAKKLHKKCKRLLASTQTGFTAAERGLQNSKHSALATEHS